MRKSMIAGCAVLMLAAPAFATEAPIADRHGPGSHFLEERPFKVKKSKRAHVQYVHRSVAQSHERLAGAIAQPARYIAGRLICALNVNAALAERGIAGPGGANSRSFLSWGRASGPQPGAVAFNYRGKRGGHVSIVAKVEADGTVWVWNPSPGGRGWQLRVNPYRSIYRAPA